jgi:hypothetical protein
MSLPGASALDRRGGALSDPDDGNSRQYFTGTSESESA